MITQGFTVPKTRIAYSPEERYQLKDLREAVKSLNQAKSGAWGCQLAGIRREIANKKAHIETIKERAWREAHGLELEADEIPF